MILEQLAGGYRETTLDIFPPNMKGNNRYFRELPHVAPRFMPFLDKTARILERDRAAAAAAWEAGFVNRSDNATQYFGSPRGVGLDRTAREKAVLAVRAGVVPEDNRGDVMSESA